MATTQNRRRHPPYAAAIAFRRGKNNENYFGPKSRRVAVGCASTSPILALLFGHVSVGYKMHGTCHMAQGTWHIVFFFFCFLPSLANFASIDVEFDSAACVCVCVALISMRGGESSGRGKNCKLSSFIKCWDPKKTKELSCLALVSSPLLSLSPLFPARCKKEKTV